MHALWRKEIQNAAPHRELASLFHQRHSVVAGRNEAIDQRVAIDRLSYLQVRGVTAHAVARWHAQCERGPGCDDDGRWFSPGRGRSR